MNKRKAGRAKASALDSKLVNDGAEILVDLLHAKRAKRITRGAEMDAEDEVASVLGKMSCILSRKYDSEI